MKTTRLLFAMAVMVGLYPTTPLFAADTALGTIVLEENFADYAAITNGTITIQGVSITPETSRVTNTELGNSITDGSNNAATIAIGSNSATVYKTAGLKVENTGTTTSKITIGANNVTVYQKGNVDTLLSGKVGTGTTVAGKALSSNVTLDSLTFGTKTYNGSSAKEITAGDLGAVPTTTTVNGKALSSNITLSAADVSALPSSTTHTSADVQLSNMKINGSALTSTTVVELGSCYILYTTTGGKTTATLYAR